MAIQYEDIDNLPEDTLRELLGDQAKDMPEDKMRARIKGAMRADEETIDGPVAVAENIVEVETEVVVSDSEVTERLVANDEKLDSVEKKSDTVTLDRAEFEALKADVNEIRRENRELKATVTSRSQMTRRARQEEQHQRARVSEYFRDILAEYRIYKTTGITKQIVVKRTFQIETEAFKNGRFAPCAKNGGMYYLYNPSWNASPRTGEIRGPIIWNRHLYVDYTIKGNKDMLLREDFKLCDWKGHDAKSFSEFMPIEDLEVIRNRTRMAEKERMATSGISEALKKIMSS